MADIKDFFKKTQEALKNLTEKVLELKKTKKKEEEVIVPALPKKELAKEERIKIEVPALTIAKAAAIVLLFYLFLLFLGKIQSVLAIFFVSLLFAAALDPIVDSMQRRRIPRWAGVILIYFGVLAVLGLFIIGLIPLLGSEIKDLAGKLQIFIQRVITGEIELPSFLSWLRNLIKNFFEGVDLSKLGDFSQLLSSWGEKLTDAAASVAKLIGSVFQNFFNAIMVFVLTFLMTVDEKGVDKFIIMLFPTRYAPYITAKSAAVKEKIGQWLRGQVMLSVIVGLLVYIGLLVIGFLSGKTIEFALTLAILAGITEIIPYFGPVVAWLFTLLIVANQAPFLMIWVTVLYLVVQQLENNFIVPLVMKQAVGLSPIFVLLALLIGYQYGVLGILLSIPIVAAIAIFVKDYTARER